MSMIVRIACLAMIFMGTLFIPLRGGAQTPQQMEYERQQREYWRQQEQQRQEQQRQQQIMNENARRQQEESSRINAPRGQGATPDSSRGLQGGGQYPGGGQAAELEKARQTWLQRPALAADRNPLLGKWMRPASTRAKSSDPFAQLGALVQGGLCEMFFGGGGVFEFRPDRMVGSDARTKEMELDRVEYRGDAKRVVVIPKTTFKLIVFDFDGPDRINWAGQDCLLVRVGAAPGHAATPPASNVQAALPPAAKGKAEPGNGAVLSLVAGFSADGGAFSPLAGSKFIVLRHSVDAALASHGYHPPPGVPIYRGWMSACQNKAPGCTQGLQGIQASALGVLTTDQQGSAHTPPLAAGTYYVFGSAKRGAESMMWNVRVELRPGENAVRLDQHNANALN